MTRALNTVRLRQPTVTRSCLTRRQLSLFGTGALGARPMQAFISWRSMCTAMRDRSFRQRRWSWTSEHW